MNFLVKEEKEEPGGFLSSVKRKIQRFSVDNTDTFLGTLLKGLAGSIKKSISFRKDFLSKLRYLPAYYLSNHLLGLNYAAENQFLSMEKAIETKK
ncbi:MAG: hypothetical protein L6Q54_06240 [Leptospiraceae bacterium]|nr:hypothetical protein [Leptospiraceae bacterium]NUM42865.1 hypothetical protein [Leptospiraceae bacterium]